jgi:hypothetical protein
MRRKASQLPLLLLAIWAILLVVLMFLRPRPRDGEFWVLIGAAVMAGVGYMVLEYLSSRRTQKEVTTWYARLSAAVDVRDYVDDGHLHEWLEPPERERLIQELQRMQPGSRSLKKALEIVSPELIDKNV